jgi:hypothetical protein
LVGFYTALSVTKTDWDPVVARRLVAAELAGCVPLVPSAGVLLEPFCAVYHRRAWATMESPVLHKRFKKQEFVSNIQAGIWPALDPGPFLSIDTPKYGPEQTEALKP